IHSAHVVNAVHQVASLGFFGIAVPIMQSRVTNLASWASIQPSVSAGRIGTTRKRVSAVQSHTRNSVSGGSAYTEVGEHRAGFFHGSRSVSEGFVPHRRQAEHIRRIARA